MTVVLAALNVTALTACVAALTRLRRNRADYSEEGRALMVTLTAVLVMTLAGFARRINHGAADQVVAAAWVAVVAAAVWAATHTPRRE